MTSVECVRLVGETDNRRLGARVVDPLLARPFVKVCGVTSVEDALLCVEAGASALGLNLYPKSPRYIEPSQVVRIREAVGGAARLVVLLVDPPLEEIIRLRDETSVDWVQLHGSEPAELVARVLPNAYKAVRMGSMDDLDEARSAPGDLVLLDSRVESVVGGSGTAFDWDLGARVSAVRRVILAGGLTPQNVSAAIERVRPFAVDVASGVESAPGRKSPEKVRAFVTAARHAFERLGERP